MDKGTKCYPWIPPLKMQKVVFLKFCYIQIYKLVYRGIQIYYYA